MPVQGCVRVFTSYVLMMRLPGISESARCASSQVVTLKTILYSPSRVRQKRSYSLREGVVGNIRPTVEKQVYTQSYM